jgi:hypothetical protein
MGVEEVVGAKERMRERTSRRVRRRGVKEGEGRRNGGMSRNDG